MAKRKFSLMGEVQNASQNNNVAPDKNPANSTPNDENDVKHETNTGKAEVRATFIVSPILIRKLKLIGTLENRKHKEIIGTALAEYIDKWEKEHPSVDLDGIDKLVK